MPKYFFHVGGIVSRPDHNGVDLEDAAEAWKEALQYASDLQAEPGRPFIRKTWHILVTGPDGFLFRLDFKSES